MDLYTTGSSLNFISSSSHELITGRNEKFIGNALQEDESSSNNMINIGSTRAGAPKYSFSKNISLNKSGKFANSLSFGSGYTLVAIIEGKGSDRGQIGMAAMDVRHSELTLCQFVDTSAYSLLRIRLSLYDPIEVILPEDKEKTSFHALILDILQNTCPKAAVNSILRRYFNDALGIEIIKKYFVQECSQIDDTVFMKYYCLAAAAALIKYVEYIQNILYSHNSLKVNYVAVEDSCMIDVNSWKNLDLIDICAKPKKGYPKSLFEILNCCVTLSGVKTLKSYLLQPSADVEVINNRLDIVQELVLNQAMCDRIRTILSTLGDLQQLISMCTYTSIAMSTNREDSKRSIRFKITQFVALKNLLDAVKELSIVIGRSKFPFFVQNKTKLDDPRLEEICTEVNDKIATEMNTRKHKGSAMAAKDMILFAVANEQHVLLDLSRKAYEELVERILAFGNQEQKEIPGAILNYSQSRGYHFSLHVDDPYSIRLPSYCIQIVFNKTSVTFTTRDLIQYNDRLIQIESEILQKSNLVLEQLIATIRQNIPALYNSTEIISLLDFYCALACYSSRMNTVRPKFGTKIDIKDGRHPILDYSQDVVPNSTFASHEESRFAIIAGPNMVGKSTYMRQVCLLQILAQVGCMVPADSASFIPFTRIFSRIGHNDDLVRNLSGFSVEMSEMASILQSADHFSLIIIDELARSTSTEEGIGICFAICERLLAIGSIVFCATHFLDMAQLETIYNGIVRNYHFASMSAIDEQGVEKLSTQHLLQEGAYKGPLYGLDLAELAFPGQIIAEAREMAERLRKTKELTESDTDQ